MKMQGKGIIARIVSCIVVIQVMLLGMPLEVFAGTGVMSNLRVPSSKDRILTDLARDGGLAELVGITDSRQAFLEEINKEIASPGTGKLPRIAVISDFHAGIKRTDGLLSDMLHELIGFQGGLERFTGIEQQLNAQGLSLQDIKEKGIVIVLNGDLLDRGQEGIECFFRLKELVEAGVAHWNLGNHDLWMLANLMKFHLPYYKGYNFYGDKEAESLIASFRESNPEYFDSNEAAYQWAAWLAEYNAMQDGLQKELRVNFGGERDSTLAEVRDYFIKEVYEKYSSQWDTQQLDVMENFIGNFARIKVPDPYVGLNGVGKTSAVWWQDVHKQLLKGYEARRNAGADESELSEWEKAVTLADSIVPIVAQRLDDAVDAGRWWYRIFESINTQAYASVEWWAKDWSSHKGWGQEAIDELNRLIADGFITGESESKYTQADYLKSSTFQEMARFYQANANLYYKAGDLISHGWFPVDADGKIGITYKGRSYYGRDLYEGLDRIAGDIKDENIPIAEKWEALNLINEWYADATTTLKSNNVEDYIKKFGVAALNAQLGVANWLTGHNPVNKFNIPSMNEEAGYRHFEIDDGIGKKFGGLGLWVYISPDGISMRGYESEESSEIVDAPVTPIMDKKTGAVKRVIENPGVSRGLYLTSLRDALEKDIFRTRVENTDLTSLSGLSKEELKGLTVVLRVDVNVLDDSGNIKSEKRIVSVLNTISDLIEKGATVVVISHNGRPKGTVKEGLKHGGIAERMQELFDEQGKDVKVVFHEDSITEEGLAPDLDTRLVKGAVNLLDNSRFCIGEEENHPSFSRALAALGNIFGFDAFGTAGRIHASTAGAAQYMQNIFTGFLMEKEDRYLEGALKNLYAIVIGGGPKVSEKVPVVKNVIRNIPEGGFIILGTGPLPAFLKKTYGIELGKKVSDPDLADAATIMKLAKAKRVEVVMPVDFVAVDADLTQEARDKKIWLDLKELPEGASVFTVTLEELRRGVIERDGKTYRSDELYLYDTGTESAKLFDGKIKGIAAGKSIFINGPLGVDEWGRFAGGQKALWQSMADATAAGVITVAGGGDTVKSAEKATVVFEGQEVKADKALTHASTGGGASAAFLQGKELEAIHALKERQATLDIEFEDINIERKDILRFRSDGRAVFDAFGGEYFKDFVSGVRNMLTREKGNLKNAEWEVEVIKDSRGRDTIRAGIFLAGHHTWGEVPAGASTGEDEANTVSTEDAMVNVYKIGEMLAGANLDLSNFDDLITAEKMIIEAAGDNFRELGANATVPVSWALWRMAASLNDMSLKEFIRWNMPQLVASRDKAQPVKFYMNIYNGGLHAVKEGESLGKDRIDIQEIMIVPEADSYAEALAMGDRVDLELKKILEEKFAADDIARADEAGFSVRGLGSSTEAIGYVIQAIRNAGYVPGEDVSIALDAAAASFYNAEKGLYEFMGEDRTSEEMIEYYNGLAEQYEGIFLSIEDGLDENDWTGWPKFTGAMTEKGILTIGDDLYVTQLGRFSHGNAEKAATAILIKVNQNGSVYGTLEVIGEAIANGIEYVVSHRSGETLDPAIADLADATHAYGLKTGDPQPEHAGYAPSELVRRNKYTRMKKLAETGSIQGKALVVSTAFLSMGGSVDALEQVLNKLDGEVKVLVYGKNAGRKKIGLNSDSVLTADDLAQAQAMLDNLGFAPENRVLLQYYDKDIDDTAAHEVIDSTMIRQIAVNDMAPLAVAKALKELMPEAAYSAFRDFYELMEKKEIIAREKAPDYRKRFLEDALSLGESLRVQTPLATEEISAMVSEEQGRVYEFMSKI